MAGMYSPAETTVKPLEQQGVIIKNSQREGGVDQRGNPSLASVSQGSQNSFQLTNIQSIISTPQSFTFNTPSQVSLNNPFASTSNSFTMSSAVPVTLQQRGDEQESCGLASPSDCHVTLPLETLQQLLSQQNIGPWPPWVNTSRLRASGPSGNAPMRPSHRTFLSLRQSTSLVTPWPPSSLFRLQWPCPPSTWSRSPCQ